MKTSQRFWRGLFFLWIITVFCSGLMQPIISSPARAAPQLQATACAGTTVAQWTFAGDVVTPSTGAGTLSVGSGLPPLTSPTFAAGNPDPAISFNAWTSARDNNKYIDLAVSTLGRNAIVLTLDYRSTGSGPTTAELHYSIDGTGFTLLKSQALSNDSNFHPLTFDLNTTPGISNNPSTVFRLYAYGASNTNGTLRLDNITFTGNCLTPVELTETAILDLTNTAVASDLTATASAVNSTGTAAAITSTASAVNATATAAALTGTNTPTSTATATATNTPTNTVPAPVPSVVISKFRTSGLRGANDEFIELYNPTAAVIDISGWKINASNNSGGTSTRATIPLSTILRSGQYYLVANTSGTDSYNNSSIPPNLVYGVGISDNGGIALLRPNDTIVDQVGMSSGSFYKEGTTLAPLTGTDESYERKSNNCQDTNNNNEDFAKSTSSPHNYASPLNLCGESRPTPAATTTTITADNPDPSVVNGIVTVSVTVTGGTSIPAGIVNVTSTGATSNCIISLSAVGTGSCNLIFTSTGTKSIVATYVGDNFHWGSSNTASHQVTTPSAATAARTPTRVPTLIPPPPLLVINEFVPRPGHDWNLDGVINVDDEYIEILNHGVIDVNLSGYSLDDEVNIGSTPFRLPSITLKPGERRVFYGNETGLLLSDGGDGVRLLKPNGQLGDAYNYFVVRFPDQSYCRLPDNGGADDWNQNCFPTPGLQNSLSRSTVNPPTAGDAENLCPIADTLPADFVFAECLPFGNNIWNPAYWDRFGWYNEKNLPEMPGKWPVFVD